MKKIILPIMIIALIAGIAFAKPVTKMHSTEYFDINGDGIKECVWVESSYKVTAKSTTITNTYFTENYLEYLGQEVLVNGQVISDTFALN
jgi:hypothetical protein